MFRVVKKASVKLNQAVSHLDVALLSFSAESMLLKPFVAFETNQQINNKATPTEMVKLTQQRSFKFSNVILAK